MAKNIVIKNVGGTNLITVSSLSSGVDIISSISGGREILQRSIVGNNIQVYTTGSQVVISANPIPNFTLTNLGSGQPIGISVSGNRDFNFRTINSRNNTVNIDITANTVDLNVNSFNTSHLIYYRFSRNGTNVPDNWLLVANGIDAGRTFTLIPYNGYYMGTTFANISNNFTGYLNIMILKNNSTNVANARMLRRVYISSTRLFSEMLSPASAVSISAGDAIGVYYNVVAGSASNLMVMTYFMLNNISEFNFRKKVTGTTLPISGPPL